MISSLLELIPLVQPEQQVIYLLGFMTEQITIGTIIKTLVNMFGSQIWFNSSNALSPATGCSGDLIDLSNLEFYLKMEDNADDSSGNGEDGTATSLTYTAGKTNFGQTGVFNGSTSKITMPTKAWGLTTAFSIGCWIKTGATGSSKYLINQDDVGSNRNFQFGVSAANVITGGSFDSGGTFRAITGTLEVCDDQWHHVMMTFDTTNGTKLYIDGAQNGLNANTNNRSNDAGAPTYIGVFNSTNLYFDGEIDEAMIWSRALTPDEITTLAAGTCPLTQFSPRDISGLGLWLDINDSSTINGGSGVSDGGTVSSWVDKSPNAFTFTQTTDSLRPVYTESDRKLTFNGDSLKVSGSNLLNDNVGTIFMSFYYNSAGNDQVIFASGDEGGSGYILFGSRPLVTGKLQKQDGVDGVDYGSTTMTNGQYYYCSISSNGSSNVFKVNGVTQSITGNDNGSWFSDTANRDNLSLGRMFRSSEYDGGGIAEINKICYFDSVITGDDLTSMETYMSDKTN